MCNYVNDPGGREGAMVPIDPDVPEFGSCDPCLVPLVRAFNQAGLTTIASCCGHGHRPPNVTLADGREVMILPDFAAARAVDRLFPVDVNGIVLWPSMADLEAAAEERWAALTRGEAFGAPGDAARKRGFVAAYIQGRMDALPEVPDDAVIEAMADGIAQFWAATDTPQDSARAAYAAMRGAMQ